jgi:hypothetical protein
VARGRILRLIFDASKWDGLYYALSLIDDPERSIQMLALDHVSRWTVRFRPLQCYSYNGAAGKGCSGARGQALPFPAEVQRRLSFFVNEN